MPTTTESPMVDQLPTEMLKSRDDIIRILDSNPHLQLQINKDNAYLLLDGQKVVICREFFISQIYQGSNEYLQIEWPEVIQGKEKNGYASAMYFLAMIYAQNLGLQLVSSNNRSELGQKLWDSLGKKGLATYDRKNKRFFAKNIPQHEINRFLGRIHKIQ